MSLPDDDAAGEAADDAAFASGFPAKVPNKTTEKPTEPLPAAPEKAPAPAMPKAEYVQVSKQDLAEFRAAAAKTASYDQQLSRLFGTTGNLQKLVNGFQNPPPAKNKFEMPSDAFERMAKDFPELAEQTKDAMQRALSGMTGGATSEVSGEKIEAMLEAFASKREMKVLEDAYPSWRAIVGAVDIKEAQPDPNNHFRKWLATKPTEYQERINASDSAAVIGRAIMTFQNETAAPAAAPDKTPREQARADRVREAIQPRGDNAGAAAGKSDEDSFIEGFKSR